MTTHSVNGINNSCKEKYMKKISRKEFIQKTGAGIAGLSLLPSVTRAGNQYEEKLRPLGKTGIMVTPLCFGASRTRDEALLRFALDKDINFLDTGRSYANGNNERMVGKAVKGNRKDIIIQSKIHLDESELTYEGKGKRGADEMKDILERRLAESLEALDTDYIDVMLYHSAEVERLVFHDTVLKFWDDQKKNGAIRSHGFSSHDYELNLVKRNNKDKFYDIIMHPFNFKGSFVHSLSKWSASWDQELLIELLREAHAGGTGIVAMKTCSAGPMGSSNDKGSYRDAVKWVLANDYISSAAVAMSSFDQVKEHMME